MSEAKFQRIFEAIPDPIFLWERQADDQIILSQANTAGLENAKGKAADFIGIDANHLYGDEPIIVKTMKTVLDTGETIHKEILSSIRTTGEKRWFLADFVKPADETLLDIAKDITERNLNEERLQQQ